MNWLAHLRLAPPLPLLRLGNLAGDFVRGIDLTTLHPELRRGIDQHRAIDRFVDGHAIVRRSRERIAPPLQRFGGVLLDVFFDHFLARDWHHHGDGAPLATFVGAVHAELEAHTAQLPPELRAAAPHFARHGWLVGYANVDGIDVVLQAMARRRPRASPLTAGVVELRQHYAAFDADFAALWPQLVAFADTLNA